MPGRKGQEQVSTHTLKMRRVFAHRQAQVRLSAVQSVTSEEAGWVHVAAGGGETGLGFKKGRAVEEMAAGGLWGWQAEVTGVVALLPVPFVLMPVCKPGFASPPLPPPPQVRNLRLREAWGGPGLRACDSPAVCPSGDSLPEEAWTLSPPGAAQQGKTSRSQTQLPPSLCKAHCRLSPWNRVSVQGPHWMGAGGRSSKSTQGHSGADSGAHVPSRTGVAQWLATSPLGLPLCPGAVEPDCVPRSLVPRGKDEISPSLMCKPTKGRTARSWFP